MTDRQSLRARYANYLQELTNRKRRPLISQLLQKWPQHLWFYYAEVSDHTKIQQLEDALISAFIPPQNSKFSADIAAARKRALQ
jgi:hypothetical protein